MSDNLPIPSSNTFPHAGHFLHRNRKSLGIDWLQILSVCVLFDRNRNLLRINQLLIFLVGLIYFLHCNRNLLRINQLQIIPVTVRVADRPARAVVNRPEGAARAFAIQPAQPQIPAAIHQRRQVAQQPQRQERRNRHQQHRPVAIQPIQPNSFRPNARRPEVPPLIQGPRHPIVRANRPVVNAQGEPIPDRLGQPVHIQRPAIICQHNWTRWVGRGYECHRCLTRWPVIIFGCTECAERYCEPCRWRMLGARRRGVDHTGQPAQWGTRLLMQ